MDIKNNESMIIKIVGGIIASLIITGIVALFSRMENLNERLIRIEERARTNTDSVNDIKKDVGDIKREQTRCADRMSLIEFKMGVLSEKP